MHKSEASVVGAFRESNTFLRTTTSIVLFFFLWLNIEPVAAAIKETARDPAAVLSPQASRPFPQAAPAAAIEQDYFDQLHETLSALQKAVKPGHDLVVKKKRKDKDGKAILDITIVGTPAEASVKVQQDKLRELALKLQKSDEETMRELAQNEEHFRKHKLAQVIFDRHNKTVSDFQQRSREVQDKLKQLQGSTSAAVLFGSADALLKKIDQWQKGQKPKFDPNKLGFMGAKSRVRRPIEDARGFKGHLSRLAKNGLNNRPVTSMGAEEPESRLEINEAEFHEISSLTHQYQIDQGSIEVASLNGGSVPPPGPEFLGATEDVQLTADVQAKADELHRNPIEIYNWVRNNVEWVPSYGSIQGSQFTLEKLSGNSFDIASLVIALLRASGIPARYVYGTIDVPIDRMQNWLGGIVNADAAQSVLGQGGIPNIALTNAGKTVAIRFEHVWVEAWVDFYPSSGFKNVTGDSWIPLDGSFKQHEITQGVTFDQLAQFNPGDFASAITAGTTIGGSQYVQGFNSNNAQLELKRFFDESMERLGPRPEATVNDVFGGVNIRQTDLKMLAASLPYRVLVRGQPMPSLPEMLSQIFHYSLFLSSDDIARNNPLLVWTARSPSIAGRKITIRFRPASADDRDAILASIPGYGGAAPLSAADFPESLASSIYVVPELRVEGIVAASGQPVPFGTELIGRGGFRSMDLEGFDFTDAAHVAGQSSALGVSLQGISRAQMERLYAREVLMKDGLASGNGIKAGDEVGGDILTSAAWTYFSTVDSTIDLASRLAGMSNRAGLSFGFVHSQVAARKAYGVTIGGKYTGLLMDMGHLRRQSISKENDVVRAAEFNQLTGFQMSELEAGVLERYSSEEGASAQGISAVRALAFANGMGQKTYFIKSGNAEVVSNLQLSAEVLAEIRNAIAVGREVIAHEAPISSGEFFGSGYVILDPVTGGGSYLIEGGAHGSAVKNLEVRAASMVDALDSEAPGSLQKVSLNPLRTLIKSVQDMLKSLYELSYYCNGFYYVALAIEVIVFMEVFVGVFYLGTIEGGLNPKYAAGMLAVSVAALQKSLEHTTALCKAL